MLCKIQPHHGNVFAAVNYNERKANHLDAEKQEDSELEGIEEGAVLATRNLPEGKTLSEEFDELQFIRLRQGTGRKMKNVSFHMSVNPKWDVDRPLSDEKYVELIDKIMDGLGFSQQPYRIYKHTDIDRAHYHVVSIRTDYSARAISDSFEHLKLRNILRELKDEYGYELYYEDEQEQDKAAAEEETIRPTTPETPVKSKDKKSKDEKNTDKEIQKKPVVPSFDRKSSTSTSDQIRNAIEDTFNWNFSTFEQWQILLQRRYGIHTEIQKKNDEEDELVFFGLNNKIQACTPPLTETALGLHLSDRLREKTENAKMSEKKDLRKRIEDLALAAAKAAETYDDFIRLMERKGAYVTVSFSRDGKPFGLTYLDRRTKCGWKGSETGTNLKWLLDVAEEKGWTIKRDKYQKLIETTSRKPSRKETYNMKTKTDVPTVKTETPVSPRRLPNILIPVHHKGSTADITRKGKEDDYFDENERLDKKERGGVDN